MKRQKSTAMIPSSSHQAKIEASSAETNLHGKSVGCMSGIIHLVCKYQSRRKFFITFGKNPEKNIIVSSSPPTRKSVVPPAKEQSDTQDGVVSQTADEQLQLRVSREAPVRSSPTIPLEIRRSNSMNSLGSFRSNTTSSPSLVARLMGLSYEPFDTPSESASEKRQKLLGALEKCDEDLKALKKIIDTVRSAELKPCWQGPSAGAGDKKRANSEEFGKGSNGGGDQEQPSPVSVLDGLARSPPVTRCMKRQLNERLQHQQQQQIETQKPGEAEGTNYSRVISLSERIKLKVVESLPLPPSACGRSSLSSLLPERYDDHWTLRHNSRLKTVIGREMKETVEQVCRDVECGERREAGRISLALQDHICRDLVEEAVKELGLLCNLPVIPPLGACKRRLCF